VSPEALASVEAYNPATNRWTPVASMSVKRQDLGVGVLGGKLYAVGGFNLEDGYLASVEVYNPANDSWN
jgi:N-acetylneuraminic acid mutarotase